MTMILLASRYGKPMSKYLNSGCILIKHFLICLMYAVQKVHIDCFMCVNINNGLWLLIRPLNQSSRSNIFKICHMACSANSSFFFDGECIYLAQ